MRLPPFQCLLDEHGADVFRFCVAGVGAQDAEDCFQDAMLAALRAYRTLRDASNLRGWLFTIAARKVLDERRARRRREIAVATVSDGAATGGEPCADGDVWSAVRRLPPMQRASILYRYAADMPYRGVAECVGCSEAAARQNVREGLRRLRREWTD
jgi:DNA-directed RNA polymerase specialized sigma24 family protein